MTQTDGEIHHILGLEESILWKWLYCPKQCQLQYFGHLMRTIDSLEKTLMLGGIRGRKKRGWQRMRWLDGITDLMDVSLSELREMVMDRGLACCDSWGCRVRHDWATELNWTELKLSSRNWAGFFIIMFRGWLLTQSQYFEFDFLYQRTNFQLRWGSKYFCAFYVLLSRGCYLFGWAV